VEPAFFYPIIPFLLVNGSQGIGTGWSTFVPTYNPKDIVDRIIAKLDNVYDQPKLTPYARGFAGTIETNPKNPGYVSNGRITILNGKSVLIDELPLGVWTSKYKDILIAMQNKGIISNFIENHTTTKVSFHVSMSASQLLKLQKSGLEKSFKLQSFLPTSNMYAFAANNELKKFNTAEEIIDDFFPIRMQMYEYRKSVIESEKLFAAQLLRNKARFIELVSSGAIELLKGKSTKQETILSLVRFGLSPMHDLLQLKNNNSFRANQDHEAKSSESGDSDFFVSTTSNDSVESGYDYLLDMPLSSLTSERVSDLKRDATKKEAELESYKSTTASELWRQDLSKLTRLLRGI
jgi:DNA topoisomerase II